jgi:hypothetical protein
MEGIPEGRNFAKVTHSGNVMSSEAQLALLSSLNASWKNWLNALDHDSNESIDPLDVELLGRADTGRSRWALDRVDRNTQA